MWSVVAVTVATFTVLLAARRVLMAGSALVFSRYVAVGGLAAFSVARDGDAYRVRFEVGGPGVFHNVTVHLFGADGPVPPPVRHTMAAGDAPIEWTVALPDAQDAWVMVTWVRPYLQGVESEALAQRLADGPLYEWRWYSETNRYVRAVIRFLARRWSGRESLRELPLYGRWRRTSSHSDADLLGPGATAPPRG